MIRRFVKDNSSVLLVIGASAGVVTTAYLSARAGYQSANALSEEDPYMELKEKARRVWRFYIPAGAAGATTILCVAGIKHVDGRKTLAAQTALAVSQRAYEGYRAQVIEELGERKDKTFRANATRDEISRNPPATIIAGSGSVLCYEAFTGRYFNCEMDTLNKAVNEINSKLIKHDYATLDDFYYLIGLENTMVSGQSGWDSNKLLELEFSSVLYKDKPCLAFDYNYVKAF